MMMFFIVTSGLLYIIVVQWLKKYIRSLASSFCSTPLNRHHATSQCIKFTLKMLQSIYTNSQLRERGGKQIGLKFSLGRSETNIWILTMSD